MNIHILCFTGRSKFRRLHSTVIFLIIIKIFFVNVLADAGLDEFNSGNYEKALEFWNGQLKDNPNSPELNYNVAILFDKGLGTDSDESKATKHYMKAAKQSYAPAMFKLGVLMAKQENYPDAVKWWLKASISDLPEAQYNLAKLYADGMGVEQDLYKAKYWFKKAAQSSMKKYELLNSVVQSVQ